MSSRTKRACDRCYNTKERCQWVADAADCDRCARLGFPCLTLRPIKKAGRPCHSDTQQGRNVRQVAKELTRSRKHEARPVRNERCGRTTLELARDLSPPLLSNPLPAPALLSSLPSEHRQLVQSMILDDAVIDTFVIGSSFWQNHRQYLTYHLIASQEILKDAFAAVALSWAHDRTGQAVPGNTDQFRLRYWHASMAIRNLRQFQVESKQHVSRCLVLGGLSLTFAYFSRIADAPAISSQVLSLIKPYYDSHGALDPEDLVFVGCLILPELLDSLLNGMVPTIRLRVASIPDSYVDRFLGLSLGILPLFYDLFELNNALLHATDEDNQEILKRLDVKQSEAEAWQPVIPNDLFKRFTAQEALHMLCQVQVMRICAFMLIHRIRFPFGINDEPNQALAKCILTQLETTRSGTSKQVVSLTFPIVVACCELKSEEDREYWSTRMPDLVGYNSHQSSHIQFLLSSFWFQRDIEGTVRWCDVGELLSSTS